MIDNWYQLQICFPFTTQKVGFNYFNQSEKLDRDGLCYLTILLGSNLKYRSNQAQSHFNYDCLIQDVSLSCVNSLNVRLNLNTFNLIVIVPG